MSLRINHNLAALNAHRNLVNTTEDLSRSMQKLSSGFRINKGSDDPAGLVISEQFRAQIAGLNRAIGNSEGSINMIQTAEGALSEINNLLVSMRELAIHAANEGFNDADQLAADQAEIDNAIATIDRIAANTQFGTKKLLDGTKENVATITTTNTTTQATIKSSGLTTGNYALSVVKTADAAGTLNTQAYGISLANTDGDPINLIEGNHNIDVVQASDVAKKESSADIAIQDAWGNDLTINATADAASLTTVASATAATAANEGTYTLLVNYQENGASAVGAQSLSVAVTNGDSMATVLTSVQNAIAANSALAGNVVASLVSADANATQSIVLSAANAGAQYSIRTELSSSDATTDLFSFAAGSDRGISNGELRFTANTNISGTVTDRDITLADGAHATMASLVTAVNTAIDATAWDTTVDLIASADGNKLVISSLDEGSDYSIQHKQLGGGAATENLLNVLNLTIDSATNTGVDALVNFNGYSNVISSVLHNDAGTPVQVTLETAAYGDADRGTIDVVLDEAAAAANGSGIQTGNMLLTLIGDKFDISLDGAAATAATAGQDATIWSADRTEWVKVNLGLTSSGGNETISNTDQSLVFQIGGNVGQTARISMRNMSGSSLGTNIVGNQFSSLADIDVQTAAGAQDAQSVIDQAINEVTTTRGTLGSFQKNTLESNLRNLRIASQNLTASESQLRDTDMAAEMSTFTKNQILVQAGVSMLAQANQIPQVVLSLFG